MSHGLVLKGLKQFIWRYHMADKVYMVGIDLSYSDKLLVPIKYLPKLTEILAASEKIRTDKYISTYGQTLLKDTIKMEYTEFTGTPLGDDFESAQVLGVSHHTFVKDRLDAKSDPVSE